MAERESYRDFARVYELFMEDMPYDSWARHIHALIRRYAPKAVRLVDGACGTGSFTRRIAAYGYEVLGFDNSEEMLEEAVYGAHTDVNIPAPFYVQQDLARFALPEPADVITVVCDGVNYLTRQREMEAFMRCACRALAPGGLLIFDTTTEGKFAPIGDGVTAESRMEGAYIWENHYDPRTRINEYALTLFLPEGDPEENEFRRAFEFHRQRAWRPQEILEAAERAGFAALRIEDAEHLKDFAEGERRIPEKAADWTAREKGLPRRIRWVFTKTA